MISIRRLLVREFLFVGMLALVLLMGTRGVAEYLSIRTQATRQAEQSFELLKESINHQVQSAESLGQVLALMWRRGQIAPGLAGTEPALEALLRQSSARNLILVDAKGDVASAHNLDGAYRTRSLVRLPEGPRVLERQWGEDGKAVSSTYLDMALPDFTGRPWYQQAMEKGTPSWTQPYLFIHPQVLGVTYCLPVRASSGALLGAAGVDLDLQKVERLTSQYQPTPNALTFITTATGERILPGAPDQPASAALRKAALDTSGADKGWPIARADGRLWLVHRDPLGARGWVLVAAIPMGDLVSVPRRITLIALVIGLLTILGITWRLMAVSRRITRPVLELAQASEGLLAEHPMPFPPTEISELALAREALLAAATSLQERQRLEGELQRIQRLELLGAMAAGLAHDLNNHLSAIQGQIEVAALKASSGPSSPHIERALEACGRMSKLLQDLVAFGKPRQIVIEKVDLNGLIQQAGRLLEHSRGKRMEVELDLDRSGPMVLGDSIQLEQVILNLGFNAKDATPEGGRISLLTRRKGREACFEISDTGTGMTAEVREKLFLPFFSTKGEGQGTGLGLAMVSSIVKAHGGRITVESEPGHGSIFTVWLPLAETGPA